MPPDMMRCQMVARPLNGLSESSTFSRCSWVLVRSPVVNTSLAAFQYHSGVPILAAGGPEEQELNKIRTPRTKKETTTESRLSIAALLSLALTLKLGVSQLERGCKGLASCPPTSRYNAPHGFGT